MGSSAVVSCFGLGAALLGFWLVARFPHLGPQTVVSSLGVVAALVVLQSPLLVLSGPVSVSLGPPAALLLVVLPSLFALFWATGCLIRSLVSLAAPFRR